MFPTAPWGISTINYVFDLRDEEHVWAKGHICRIVRFLLVLLMQPYYQSLEDFNLLATKCSVIVLRRSTCEMETSLLYRTSLSVLEFPPNDNLDLLKGKSNFPKWHSSIQPILLSNPHSSKLILDGWTEPEATDYSHRPVEEFDRDRREWHTINTATCRFIRSTLALNVTPFVRQHNTAKVLYFNLVWLYGDDAGIDTQGGPPLPPEANRNSQRNRTSLLAALEKKGSLGQTIGIAVSTPTPATNSNTNPIPSSLPTRTAFVNHSGTSVRKSRLNPNRFPSASCSRYPQSHLCLSSPSFLERGRASPCLSLETIPEEPHPGRRVLSGQYPGLEYDENGRADELQRSVSPLTLSGGSDEDDEVSSPIASSAVVVSSHCSCI